MAFLGVGALAVCHGGEEYFITDCSESLVAGDGER